MEPRWCQVWHRKKCHCVSSHHMWWTLQWEQDVSTIPQGNSKVHSCYQRSLQTLLLMAPDLQTYPPPKEGRIKYSGLDHVSSFGRIYFSDKYGKNTGSPWVIFFRTLVLKRYLSGHLTDDSTWVTVSCDNGVFCCCYIKCSQPLPVQSAWDKTITKAVLQALSVVTPCWLNFAKRRSQVTNWSNISYLLLVLLPECVFQLPCSSEVLGNIWWFEDLFSGLA